MSPARAPVTHNVTQISVADRLPEEGKPSEFYKDVLDGVNDQARYYGWRGVSFEQVRYSKQTRVFSVTVSRGKAPATLHLMQKHLAETSSTEGLAG